MIDQHVTDACWRIAGAILGGAVSLAYLPAKSWPEFMSRALVAIIIGVVAAPVAEFHFRDQLPPGAQGAIFAACVCGAMAWWVFGAAIRLVKAYRRSQGE